MKTTIFTLALLLGGMTSLKAQNVNEFTGAVDHKFSNAGNWSLGTVPSDSDSIIVGVPGDSMVFDMNVTIDNIVIKNGSKVSFCDMAVTVKGNIDNQSSQVCQGTGTVTLQGTAAQTIKGNNNFSNLVIDNPNGVTILSGQNRITGSLNVQDGTLYTNDNLVIESSANVGPIGNGIGNISGNVTVEKTFVIDSSGWVFLASPLTSTPLTEVNDDIWTSGIIGSNQPNNGFPSIYTYDETVSGTSDYGSVPATNITDVIPAGVGFMAYMTGNSFTAGTIDFHGQLNNGNVNIPITYTNTGSPDDDGWNYVGNPFASTLDWDHNSISKTNIDDAIYIWSPENQQYVSYVDGIGTNGGSNLISSCQGFWVKANASGASLSIPQGAKKNSTATFVKSSNTIDYLSIVIGNGAVTDETVLRANPNASQTFESQFDALKMEPNTGNPSVFTSFDGQSEIFSINQFNNQETEIYLSAFTGSTGMHTITFNGVDYFSENQCVILEDMFTGDSYPLTEGFNLDVMLSDTTTVPRFKIVLGAPLYVQGYDVSCNGLGDGHINVAKNSNDQFDVIWKDENGSTIAENTGVYQITSFDDVYPGTYYAEITDDVCGLYIQEITINEPLEVIATFDTSVDTLIVGNQNEVEFTSHTNNASLYHWEIDGQVFSTEMNTMLAFDEEGIYNVTHYVYQSQDCYAMENGQIVVVGTVGFNTEDSEVDMRLINGQLSISGQTGNSELIVSNISGQVLMQQAINEEFEQVNLQHIPSQVILVSIVSDEGVTSKKFSF